MNYHSLNFAELETESQGGEKIQYVQQPPIEKELSILSEEAEDQGT